MNTTPETVDRPSAPDASPTTDPPAGISWPLRVLTIVGPVVALMLATLGPAALSALLPAMGDDTPAGAVVAVVVVQSLITCAAAIALAALLLKAHGLRLRDAGFRWTRVSLPSLLTGLTIGAVVVLAVGIPLTRLGLLRADEAWGLPWWALVIAGLAQGFALQGVPEEVLFRGYQMTALRLRPLAALFVSATVFASIHLISRGGQESALERLYYLAMPFGFAIAGGALMILTDSLWGAVGVHSGVHVGSLVAVFFGVGNGPELWLLCGAVWTVVGVALLMVAHRRGQLASVWRGPQH